jgi:hypothetical protein
VKRRRRPACGAATLLVLAFAAHAVPAAPQAAAPGPLTVRLGPLRVHSATPGGARLARRLAETAAASLEFPALPPDLLRDGPPIHIYIAADAEDWHRLTGGRVPDWGAGVTIRNPERIVLPGFAARRGSTPDLERTLRHELAHVALGRYLGPALIPRWFDEGYARWAAGEWDMQAAWDLRVAFMMHRAPPLDSLTLDWPAAAAEAQLAYALGTTAVAYLVDRSGERGLRLFLERWRETTSMEQALRRTYGVTSSQFEEHWRAWVRKRYGWLFMVSHSLVFWALVVLATLILFMPRRARDRRRLEVLRDTELPDQPAWWLEPADEGGTGGDPPGGEAGPDAAEEPRGGGTT